MVLEIDACWQSHGMGRDTFILHGSGPLLWRMELGPFPINLCSSFMQHNHPIQVPPVY